MQRLSGSVLSALVAGLCAGLVSLGAGAQTGTPANPAAAAAAAAAAARVPTLAEIKANVSLSQQQDKFGNYAPGSGENQFLGGKGDATGDGTIRKAACTGNTTDPECFAIQALQRTRGKPAAWVPPNSPQLAGRDAVVKDPQGTLGVDPATVAGATAAVQCRTESVATPEVREENHCVVSTPDVAQSCSLGVEVEVDPDYVYKCLIRTATNSSVACSVGQVVTVDSTTTYRCVERMRSAAPNTCTVNRVIEVDANSKYVCVNQERTSADAQCAVGSVVEVRADTGYQCVNQVRQATDTACTVGSVVEVRADANYQCVDQARTVANAACSVGQVVTIDPKFNYTCQNTANVITTNTCARKLITTCPLDCNENLRITVSNPQPAALNLTIAGGAVHLKWPYEASLVSFNLRLEGAHMGPVTFRSNNGRNYFGSVYKVPASASTKVWGYSGNQPQDMRSGLPIGVDLWVTVLVNGVNSGDVSILFPVPICQKTCVDTWDDSQCAPYKQRL